jgi:hypothetical protein
MANSLALQGLQFLAIVLRLVPAGVIPLGTVNKPQKFKKEREFQLESASNWSILHRTFYRVRSKLKSGA